ncbi:Leucine-rich_repeat domain superfamily [Hexamita inflata]|uniref:Leucine-rich_repeat domain superfamily n=1 Tax=Hexamita inflata TaxID=28002 RepID=A0ABP1GSV4_9EUKA
MLDISSNPGIYQQQLAQLTQLTKLEMKYCQLINVDFLVPLVNLNELDLSGNSIIYIDISIDPILGLQQLWGLQIDYNFIIDIQNMQMHPNFNCFKLDNQKQPTLQQIQVANKLNYINSSNALLKQIKQKSTITQQMSVRKARLQQQVRQCLFNHIQNTNKVVQLFQYLDVKLSVR